jgi:hypothetical protein
MDLPQSFQSKKGKMGINLLTVEGHLKYMRKVESFKAEFVRKYRHYAVFCGGKLKAKFKT